MMMMHAWVLIKSNLCVAKSVKRKLFLLRGAVEPMLSSDGGRGTKRETNDSTVSGLRIRGLPSVCTGKILFGEMKEMKDLLTVWTLHR